VQPEAIAPVGSARMGGQDDTWLNGVIEISDNFGELIIAYDGSSVMQNLHNMEFAFGIIVQPSGVIFVDSRYTRLTFQPQH
jgi:hypothetical protein